MSYEYAIVVLDDEKNATQSAAIRTWDRGSNRAVIEQIYNFDGEVEALNHMASQGWRFVSSHREPSVRYSTLIFERTYEHSRSSVRY